MGNWWKIAAVKLNRTHLKDVDQGSWPPQIAGFHILILRINVFKRRGSAKKRSIHGSM